MGVAVALSGGADSLLALCLLQEQGYDPVAVHAKFLDPTEQEIRVQENLASVCARLGVNLRCLDLRQAFAREVIQPFVQAYAHGLTPNPCAVCNQRMKFGHLLHEVQNMGLEGMATGHYVRISWECVSPPGLYRGQDRGKDQSYFLALVSREQLTSTIFPLASWEKSRVTVALDQRGVIPSAGRESQEICFIPDNDYRVFLTSQLKALPGPGPIVDEQGRLLGRHQGLHCYTLGQRRGLGIAFSEPLYVLEKQMKTNTLVVGPRRCLQARSCRVGWINPLVPVRDWPEELWVQTNYRQAPTLSGLTHDNSGWTIEFSTPRPPAPPGQIAVFYSTQGRVLGGGIIRA